MLFALYTARTMYTIKEAAARTGSPCRCCAHGSGATAWSRRHARPAAIASTTRRRSAAAVDAAVDRRRLVGECRGGRDHRRHGSAGRHPGRFDGRGTAGPLVEQLVDAAAALDSPRIEAVLDDMFAGGTYERVVEDHVIPALRALGDAWAAGRVPVAGEHVASNAVLRRLAASFQASGPDATRAGRCSSGCRRGRATSWAGSSSRRRCAAPGSRSSTSGRTFRWTTGSRPSSGRTRGRS